jgi:hypothetical protein
MGAVVCVFLAMLQATMGDAPKDVVDFFRSVASTLGDANGDGNAKAFLEHFDPAMPDYAVFSDQIEAMVGAGEVSTSIDFVNTDGDDRKRTMELDWLLLCEGESPKRAVVKCTIEKRGKKWKITSLAPVAFFKRN